MDNYITSRTIVVRALNDIDAYGSKIQAGTKLLVTGDPHGCCTPDEIPVTDPYNPRPMVGMSRALLATVV